MSASAPASPYGIPVKSNQKGSESSDIDISLMKLVGEAIGNENVAQWYSEALEIKRLYQSMPHAKEK